MWRPRPSDVGSKMRAPRPAARRTRTGLPGVRGLAGDRGCFEEFVTKYGLDEDLRMSRMVTATRWDDAAGRWVVEARNLLTGVPTWPSVSGIETYGGAKLHGADYDEGVSLGGKDILLTDGGSSTDQILPAIQPIASRVKIFIRSLSWMLPDISTKSGAYTPPEIERFVNDPHAVRSCGRTTSGLWTTSLRSLQDKWAASVAGHIGMVIPEYPNTFTLLGTWTPASNGPTLVAIEAQADYVCASIDRWQTESTLSSVRRLQGVRGAHDGEPGVDGRVPELAQRPPGGSGGAYADDVAGLETLNYLEAMREVRWDGSEFSYKGNRFAWLGDGVSRAEWEPRPNSPTTPRARDDGPHGSRRARGADRQGRVPAAEGAAPGGQAGYAQLDGWEVGTGNECTA
ncbi:hypothetical protein DL765_010807 [Monosporascus sp. GIB2]|nr:hypothetical protein DL765_010807 [Monosporascus sp. GIB2]